MFRLQKWRSRSCGASRWLGLHCGECSQNGVKSLQKSGEFLIFSLNCAITPRLVGDDGPDRPRGSVVRAFRARLEPWLRTDRESDHRSAPKDLRGAQTPRGECRPSRIEG